MKIMMLGWELPPHNSGGLGVACYHISKALADRGAEIDFVVPYTADHPGIDFMNIHCATKLDPLHRCGMGAYSTPGNFTGSEKTHDHGDCCGLRDLRGIQHEYVQFVEQMTTDLEPDVIHVHDWLTMEAGVRAKQISGAPLVVHVHATEYDRSGGGYGNPLVHEIEYEGLMMADRIIAVSKHTKEIIVREYGIPADKIEVVYNSVGGNSFSGDYEYDSSTYKYVEAMKKEGYTVVSYVGRLTLQKGLTFFLKAASAAVNKYDKLLFLLAGDGEQRDELIRMAADYGIADKILFTGFVRGYRWRDTFSVSDIFVMSSISEPFGLTALEAAYHENAIILTKQSGVGEVMKSVFRYDFWDENALADEIVGLATSKSLLHTMQKEAKEEYERLSWQDVSEKFVSIYKQIKGVKKS